MSEQLRCESVTDDGSCCGQQCDSAAEWRFNTYLGVGADDSDYEEFVVCSKCLADMLQPNVEYLVRSLE